MQIDREPSATLLSGRVVDEISQSGSRRAPGEGRNSRHAPRGYGLARSLVCEKRRELGGELARVVGREEPSGIAERLPMSGQITEEERCSTGSSLDGR